MIGSAFRSIPFKPEAVVRHKIVSRATDVNGVVQPTAAELTRKKTFLEDNAQFPRKVTIA